MKTCSVEGCGKPTRSKGMCQSHYDKQYRPGYEATHQEQIKANRRAQYERHGEKIAEYRRIHIEERRAYDRARYLANKEETKARVMDYTQRNRDRIRASNAARYKQNPDPVKARARKWAKDNPERSKLMKAAGRKRDRIAEGSHDYMQLRELLKKQSDRCIVCRVALGKRRHKDHIVPLSAGGTNWITNIQFLCPTCNLQKNRKDPISFMQQKGFLL